jgi:uncharacterized protein (TIGR02145 family)
VITISGTPTATGSFSYEIPLTGGCGSVKATGNITVSATPACSVSTASSTPTLTVSTALTPNITHTTTSATGIGILTGSGLPSGVTANWSSNVITISGTPSVTGTFNYTIPLTGTSCSGVNATGTITVNAPPACGSVTSVTIEGYSYPTVSIGTQCWMAENLRVTKYNDGVTLILDETANTAGWGGLATGARTDYTGATGISGAVPSGQTYVSTYGYLYNWFAVNDANGLCPSGWHVPTDAEWSTLTTYLNTVAPTGSVGGKMKSTGDNTAGTGLWNSPNTGADNSSGFSALPGGFRNNVGSFFNISNNAFFWSATESSINNAWYRSLPNSGSGVTRSFSFKSVGASVRCLRD